MTDYLPWILFGVYVVFTEVRLHRMRRKLARYTAMAVLLGPGTAAGFPGLTKPVNAYQPGPSHPDKAAFAALQFLADLKPTERCYYRFFTFLSVLDKDDLLLETTNFRGHLPMANGYGAVPPKPFPIDKDGRVWALDIREVGWSAAAFHAVARLDPTCREPHVSHRLAEDLRKSIGVELDPKTFHVEAMVPGPWFVRQLEETDLQRTDPNDIVYYNLLYSRERFGDDDHSHTAREPEKPRAQTYRAAEGKPWVDGKVYPKDFEFVAAADQEAYDRAMAAWKAGKGTGTSNGFIDRNFPRDKKDFEKRWGVKAVKDFLDSERAFAANGAVISGGFNDPKTGSVVAPNDRAIRIQRTAFGVGMSTNDFARTSGKGNLVNFPFQVATDDLDEDASESIHSKQDGFPAWFINGAKAGGSKRVESGDPHIVFDKINGSFPIVQTYWKCVGCHYPSNVVLPPSNHKLLKSLQKRNELLTIDKKQSLIMDQFYWAGDANGEGWNWKLDDWRKPFARSLAVATRSKDEPKGWDGTQFASVSNFRREVYDAPVTLDRAAAELGYSRLAVVGAAAFLTSIDGQKAFGNLTFDAATLLLADDEPGVPRAAFDDDLFIPLAKTLAIGRDKSGAMLGIQFLIGGVAK